ncbi:MAG: hypothetical protein E7018_00630 [Alphaproteobacteria bacterium]|nr:hypothetical protein [Alphaproteobacteria bacterium]
MLKNVKDVVSFLDEAGIIRSEIKQVSLPKIKNPLWRIKGISRYFFIDQEGNLIKTETIGASA